MLANFALEHHKLVLEILTVLTFIVLPGIAITGCIVGLWEWLQKKREEKEEREKERNKLLYPALSPPEPWEDPPF